MEVHFLNPKQYSQWYQYMTNQRGCDIFGISVALTSDFIGKSLPESFHVVFVSFCREKEPIKIYLQHHLLQGLVHVIMEAEKSQDLQTASGRPSYSTGIQYQYTVLVYRTGLEAFRLKTQEELSFHFLFEGRKRPMSQLKQSERKSTFFLSLFVLFRSSADQIRSTHMREINLLQPVY